AFQLSPDAVARRSRADIAFFPPSENPLGRILRQAQPGRVLARTLHMSDTRKSALIAEDDEALRRMMVTILRPLDIKIDEARDGFEAVQRLREHPYDVVRGGLMMPRVDGLSVI